MSPHRVVFLGVATLDTIALVDHMPAPDERQVAELLVHAGGGPAATAAVTAARLGLAGVAFVGTVGDDAEGERVLAELADEGVDVSGVLRRPDVPTGASVVIVDRSRGTRAICNRPVPPLELVPGSRGAEIVAAADWLHVDQLGWASVGGVVGNPGGPTAPVSVDAGNPVPGYVPRGVALDVPTAESLLTRYRASDLDAAMARAVDEGAERVVVTRGAAGSVALTADGERASVPAARTEVLSTLGAGDVFHGALVTAVVRGEPLARAMAYAGAVAALSCRGLDGRSRIPTHDEATALAATIEEMQQCPTP